MLQSPPPIDGVVASRVQLPQGVSATLLDGLCGLFPAISRERWTTRLAGGRVLDATGVAFSLDSPYRIGAEVYYYREVEDELPLPGGESVLHVDAHLVVADKPHGLPVAPVGRSTTQTLQARLIRALANPHLVPLHRIDRDTAGLVLFSANPATRKHYHALFRERGIGKRYEAIAPPLPTLEFPLVRRSKLVRGHPFFRMQELPGTPNSETRIEVVERGMQAWRYGLQPVSGRKHQLRVHMAALGAPIVNDRLYPAFNQADQAGLAEPLQLVAKQLQFIDPIDGGMRLFESRFGLDADLVR